MQLACPICLVNFDGHLHIPMMIGVCAHTICKPCLESLLKLPRDKKICPECRGNIFEMNSVNEFHKNYALI